MHRIKFILFSLCIFCAANSLPYFTLFIDQLFGSIDYDVSPNLWHVYLSSCELVVSDGKMILPCMNGWC